MQVVHAEDEEHAAQFDGQETQLVPDAAYPAGQTQVPDEVTFPNAG